MFGHPNPSAIPSSFCTAANCSCHHLVWYPTTSYGIPCICPYGPSCPPYGHELHRTASPPLSRMTIILLYSVWPSHLDSRTTAKVITVRQLKSPYALNHTPYGLLKSRTINLFSLFYHHLPYGLLKPQIHHRTVSVTPL